MLKKKISQQAISGKSCIDYMREERAELIRDKMKLNLRRTKISLLSNQMLAENKQEREDHHHLLREERDLKKLPRPRKLNKNQLSLKEKDQYQQLLEVDRV
jgi:hypothetical protein